MASKLQLKTTDAQFEILHHTLDHTRRTSSTVKASREALTNILMDHAAMVERLEKIDR